MGALGGRKVDAEAQLSALEEETRVPPNVAESLEIADRQHGRVLQSGDELRVSRTTGEVEIAPTGIPGLVDRLQQAIEDLRKSWFGK